MTPLELAVAALALLIVAAQCLCAVFLNEAERRHDAEVRARAQEALARRQCRPFVDIDVERR